MAHAETGHEQAGFYSWIRSLIQQAVAAANRDLAQRPGHYQIREASGYYDGHCFDRRSTCNPIACELYGDGRKLGEAMLVELTADGMIEASLVPPRSGPAVPMTRADLGWSPVPLHSFTAKHAADLIAWYLAAITTRVSMHGEPRHRRVKHVGRVHI